MSLLVGQNGTQIYMWNFLKPEGSLDQHFENNGDTINQTITVFNTEQEADNFKNWVHSGELSGKGRLRGLFSILLRAEIVEVSTFNSKFEKHCTLRHIWLYNRP